MVGVIVRLESDGRGEGAVASGRMRRTTAYGRLFGGLALVLAGACAAIVLLAEDGARGVAGLAPVAVYGWLERPTRVDRVGVIPLVLASVVLLVFVAAWALGGRDPVGVAAATAGVVAADRTLWLVRRLVQSAYR